MVKLKGLLSSLMDSRRAYMMPEKADDQQSEFISQAVFSYSVGTWAFR